MARDDEVLCRERDLLDRTFVEGDSAFEPRPRVYECEVKLVAGRRKRRVDDTRLDRRVVENQEDVCEQAMTGGNIDDAPTAEEATNASRDLPGFEELLAGKTTGGADGASDTIDERVARKPVHITRGEASL